MPPRIDAPPAAAAAVLDERRVRRHDLARVRGVQHVRVRVGVVRARQEPRRRPASHAARVLVASRLPAGHVHLLPRAGVPHAELQLSHSISGAGLRGGGVEQLRQRGRLAGRAALHVLDIVLEHGGGVDADALEARVAPRGEALDRPEVEVRVGDFVARAEPGLCAAHAMPLLNLVPQVPVRRVEHEKRLVRRRAADPELRPRGASERWLRACRRGVGGGREVDPDRRAVNWRLPPHVEILWVHGRQLDPAPVVAATVEPRA
mmetsp:Transcript_11090/g.36614  ORF Transcript_11090/g.36614 Transcript_11090/m.36614 type:complete len:262 (+) Transcript_11090:679-1464(+)